MMRLFKQAVLIGLFGALAWADPVADHPTGNRTTPPTIEEVSPLGVARGTTSSITVKGFNLAGASGVTFSEPGIEGRIVSIKELPEEPEPVRLGSGGLPSAQCDSACTRRPARPRKASS